MTDTVIVFHQEGCHPCRTAMEYLRQRGIPFTARNVSNDPAAQEELLALGSRSTPTIKIGAEVLIGFSPSRIQKALERL